MAGLRNRSAMVLLSGLASLGLVFVAYSVGPSIIHVAAGP
ncbi:MAG: hypothetical protein K0R85_156 [Devosia sp.]|jgi:hypothetical protein|nr:hypothetical protein [Devosia sp.]